MCSGTTRHVARACQLACHTLSLMFVVRARIHAAASLVPALNALVLLGHVLICRMHCPHDRDWCVLESAARDPWRAKRTNEATPVAPVAHGGHLRLDARTRTRALIIHQIVWIIQPSVSGAPECRLQDLTSALELRAACAQYYALHEIEVLVDHAAYDNISVWRLRYAPHARTGRSRRRRRRSAQGSFDCAVNL